MRLAICVITSTQIILIYRTPFAGLTAYFVSLSEPPIPFPTLNSAIFPQGLKDVGKIKAGETLVVSGAAGSVGVIACQLGKRAGAKVYALAGSKEKCEWLEKEVGVDKALNYKSENFKQEFKDIGYLDVFFDNVGGQ